MGIYAGVPPRKDRIRECSNDLLNDRATSAHLRRADLLANGMTDSTCVPNPEPKSDKNEVEIEDAEERDMKNLNEKTKTYAVPSDQYRYFFSRRMVI